MHLDISWNPSHAPTIARWLDDRRARRDLGVLRLFVGRYCAIEHGTMPRSPYALALWSHEIFAPTDGADLCESCARLLSHGAAKRLLCPFDPKPMCKDCTAHCYAVGYREQMRKVMRVAGWDLIKHGRIDLLWHYLF